MSPKGGKNTPTHSCGYAWAQALLSVPVQYGARAPVKKTKDTRSGENERRGGQWMCRCGRIVFLGRQPAQERKGEAQKRHGIKKLKRGEEKRELNSMACAASRIGIGLHASRIPSKNPKKPRCTLLLWPEPPARLWTGRKARGQTIGGEREHILEQNETALTLEG